MFHVSASPFISLAMSPVREEMAIGSYDGKVGVWEVTIFCIISLNIKFVGIMIMIVW